MVTGHVERVQHCTSQLCSVLFALQDKYSTIFFVKSSWFWFVPSLAFWRRDSSDGNNRWTSANGPRRMQMITPTQTASAKNRHREESAKKKRERDELEARVQDKNWVTAIHKCIKERRKRTVAHWNTRLGGEWVGIHHLKNKTHS